MKRFLSVLAAVAACLGLAYADQQNSPQENYIHKYASTAQAEMRRTGVPASITLAQGILESNSGLSTLSRESNNHFGIKCHKTWTGKKVYHDDDAKGECFRAYAKPEDSFRDHSDFLRYNDRYKSLFDLDLSDYKSWCFGLKAAGYATDPKYATKLIDIIEKYNLGRYDIGKVEVASPGKLEQAKVVTMTYNEEYKFKVSRTLYSNNGVEFVYAKPGDTYSSLASLYDLFNFEILAFNDAPKGSELIPGEIVYIHRKKNRTAKGLDKYIVGEDGEDLREICQRFGVKQSKVMKRNKIGKDDILCKDQEILLR